MADAPETKHRMLAAIGALALAGVGIYWLVDDEPEPAAPAPASEEDDAAGLASHDSDFAGEEGLDDAPADDPIEGYDPERYARILFDGGVPEPPARGRVESVADAIARNEARAAARPAREREPATPEQRLRQATFWRDLLERRVQALEAQRDEARQRGDTRAAQRAQRHIDRLNQQRPSIEQQIERVEQEIMDAQGTDSVELSETDDAE